MNGKARQHPPLRVPEGWQGQSRALIIQLEQILDDIYARLPERGAIKDLEERVTALEEE